MKIGITEQGTCGLSKKQKHTPYRRSLTQQTNATTLNSIIILIVNKL